MFELKCIPSWEIAGCRRILVMWLNTLDGDPDNTFSFSAEEWENDPSLVWSFQSRPNCYVGGVT